MSGAESNELKALRSLVRKAVSSFEFSDVGTSGISPKDILHEVLLCAQSDFSVINNANQAGSGTVSDMVFRRAEIRIDLGLALADYCERFGWPEKPTEDAEDESEMEALS